jgi:hypothetical protein
MGAVTVGAYGFHVDKGNNNVAEIKIELERDSALEKPENKESSRRCIYFLIIFIQMIIINLLLTSFVT